jgi:hypothetical protein
MIILNILKAENINEFISSNEIESNVYTNPSIGYIFGNYYFITIKKSINSVIQSEDEITCYPNYVNLIPVWRAKICLMIIEITDDNKIIIKNLKTIDNTMACTNGDPRIIKIDSDEGNLKRFYVISQNLITSKHWHCVYKFSIDITTMKIELEENKEMFSKTNMNRLEKNFIFIDNQKLIDVYDGKFEYCENPQNNEKEFQYGIETKDYFYNFKCQENMNWNLNLSNKHRLSGSSSLDNSYCVLHMQLRYIENVDLTSDNFVGTEEINLENDNKLYRMFFLHSKDLYKELYNKKKNKKYFSNQPGISIMIKNKNDDNNNKKLLLPMMNTLSNENKNIYYFLYDVILYIILANKEDDKENMIDFIKYIIMLYWNCMFDSYHPNIQAPTIYLSFIAKLNLLTKTFDEISEPLFMDECCSTGINFACGLSINDNKSIISYGVDDAAPFLLSMDNNEFNTILTKKSNNGINFINNNGIKSMIDKIADGIDKIKKFKYSQHLENTYFGIDNIRIILETKKINFNDIIEKHKNTINDIVTNKNKDANYETANCFYEMIVEKYIDKECHLVPLTILQQNKEEKREENREENEHNDDKYYMKKYEKYYNKNHNN